MTSNSDYKFTIDDDDDFDWDAAVREIEAACQVSKLPSTSSCSEQPSLFPPPNNHAEKKKSGASSSRQSTLDDFVGKAKAVPRPQVKVVQEHHFGNERLPAVQIDVEAAKTWIYPVNVPLRDYQLAITQKALFSNTLVALPTGLGKTLIAAVVMYNYFRWFPDGKIVFAAPSRPLVMQQIEACHNIVGIPQEWTIDMTGQINPTKRACFWKSKRVFFVTPQVLEKDIESGTCLVNRMVCLVIDEAHRALGNYSYCVAIRQLMDVPVELRILALTATPGSKQQTIQKIIDNLHISTLEYRNENDQDVIPYVHNRKLELIQVPMGKEAVEIHNKLLDIIRPYVARLCASGVLPNRDYQTLSPCELLNSRDKFRQAPPLDLSHVKYGEIEGYFGVLITLYHIRKLLSSHGIRPAYEMLEEKLKQGLFAKYMSKNEDLFKARLTMQQSLSHGAQSPKLSKMLEVLIDHFKTKDPGNSRVIIFSNFRGSVRDIMDALANIGDLVRAAQFIGQSSGKTLKGQSQKVQQAVLEKFRAGGYNVIVATSIGEEGLDIMEVDLVICFDANVSPLRMIQRMGRTGRKHDGRVVVLACEGSEFKGYMRKQANGKTVRKHMLNGGMNSFNFHCSPRMIPHIYKPEVQFVKFSIEEFVRRGKKVKDNETVETPVFIDKLTDAEANLIAKYFSPTGDIAWKPSLIAFPHFQTFPSRVHKVSHSCKTTLLIDAMQNLQGLYVSKGNKVSLPEDEVLLEECQGADNVEHHDNKKDFLLIDECLKQSAQGHSFGYIATEIFEAKGNKSVCNSPSRNPQEHSYLFGSDFISVDPLGKVLIVSVPFLSSKEVAHPQHTSACNVVLLDCSNQDSIFLRTSVEDHKKLSSQAEGLVTSKARCSSQGKTLDEIENVPLTPDLKGKLLQERDGFCETLDAVEVNVSMLLPDDFRDSEFSPRLTNMIQSGIVPESPDNCSDCLSPAQPCIEAQTKPSATMENEMVTINSKACGSNVSVFPTTNEIQSPIRSTGRVYAITSPSIGKSQSPLMNSTNNSCSKDWCLSENNSGSIKQARRLKRLRKAGGFEKNKGPENIKDSSLLQVTDFVRSFTSTRAVQHKHGRGNKKRAADSARVFIEEEAEVSTDADTSDDEEDSQENNSCDSFIDDRINPTVVETQSETRTDMIAIYRRSLLSQSPMLRQQTIPARDSHSPASMAPTTRTSATGSSSKASGSFPTPQTDYANHSTSRDSNSSRMNEKPEVVPGPTEFSSKHDSEIEIRKRKLSYCPSSSLPAINLEKEFELQFEAASRSLQDGEANQNMLSDDIFFEGLDLDAIEEQAAFLLKQKSEVSVQKPEIIHQSNPENATFCSPSFDLGI